MTSDHGSAQYDFPLDADADHPSKIPVTATIVDIYPLVMNESPEHVKRAAKGWADLAAQIQKTAKELHDDFGKVKPHWHGDSGWVFGDALHSVGLSFEDWHPACIANSKALYTLEQKIQAAKDDMEALWKAFNHAAEHARTIMTAPRSSSFHGIIKRMERLGATIVNPFQHILYEYTDRTRREVLEPLNAAYSEAYGAMRWGGKWLGPQNGPTTRAYVKALSQLSGAPGVPPGSPPPATPPGMQSPPSAPPSLAEAQLPPSAPPAKQAATPFAPVVPPIPPVPQPFLARAPVAPPAPPSLSRQPVTSTPLNSTAPAPPSFGVPPHPSLGAPPGSAAAQGFGDVPPLPPGQGLSSGGLAGPPNANPEPAAESTAPGGQPQLQPPRPTTPDVPHGLSGRGGPGEPEMPPRSGMRNPPPPQLRGRSGPEPGRSTPRSPHTGEPEIPPARRSGPALPGRMAREQAAERVDHTSRSKMSADGLPNPLGLHRNLLGTHDTNPRWASGSDESEDLTPRQLSILSGRLASQGTHVRESARDAEYALPAGFGGRGSSRSSAPAEPQFDGQPRSNDVHQPDAYPLATEHIEMEQQATDFVGDSDLFSPQQTTPAVIRPQHKTQPVTGGTPSLPGRRPA